MILYNNISDNSDINDSNASNDSSNISDSSEEEKNCDILMTKFSDKKTCYDIFLVWWNNKFNKEKNCDKKYD